MSPNNLEALEEFEFELRQALRASDPNPSPAFVASLMQSVAEEEHRSKSIVQPRSKLSLAYALTGLGALFILLVLLLPHIGNASSTSGLWFANLVWPVTAIGLIFLLTASQFNRRFVSS